VNLKQNTNNTFTASWYDVEVAGKKLDQLATYQTYKNFKNEISILSQLHHRSIVTFIGYCQEPDQKLLITEFMPGANLYTLLHVTKQELNPQKILIFAKQIASAMNYMHQRVPPIIHKNLNTYNIFVNEQLSLSKIQNFEYSHLKTNTDVKYTSLEYPAYIAPEVMQGISYDEKIDVYSYALILYEMISRNIPFENSSSSDIYKKVVEQNSRPDINNCSIFPSLKALIVKCWDANPVTRLSFEEIVLELKNITI